jgi:hypothetical protein
MGRPTSTRRRGRFRSPRARRCAGELEQLGEVGDGADGEVPGAAELSRRLFGSELLDRQVRDVQKRIQADLFEQARGTDAQDVGLCLELTHVADLDAAAAPVVQVPSGRPLRPAVELGVGLQQGVIGAHPATVLDEGHSWWALSCNSRRPSPQSGQSSGRSAQGARSPAPMAAIDVLVLGSAMGRSFLDLVALRAVATAASATGRGVQGRCPRSSVGVPVAANTGVVRTGAPGWVAVAVPGRALRTTG